MTKKKAEKKKTTKVKVLPKYIRSIDLALMFDVTPRRIERLVNESGMPKESRGTYKTIDCVRWYINFWRKKARNGNEEKNKQQISLIEAQTEKTILQTEKMREQLLPVEEIAHTLNSMATIVATQLDGLGPRMANTLANINEPSEIQRSLFEECRNIRNAIADQIISLASEMEEN